MPRRSKIPDDVPSGNPILGRLAKLDRRVDDHEVRLTSAEVELRELNLDMALLGDMVVSASELAIRARQRAAARVIARPRPRRRR